MKRAMAAGVGLLLIASGVVVADALGVFGPMGRNGTPQVRVPTTSAGTGVVARCRTNNLQLSERLVAKGAGSTYFLYTIKNTGTTACSLKGVPRLAFSYASPGAHPVGRVYRQQGPAPAVTLAPGGIASFYENFGGCTFSPTFAKATMTYTFTVTMPAASRPLLSHTTVGSPPSCSTYNDYISHVYPGTVSIPGQVAKSR